MPYNLFQQLTVCQSVTAPKKNNKNKLKSESKYPKKRVKLKINLTIKFNGLILP